MVVVTRHSCRPPLAGGDRYRYAPCMTGRQDRAIRVTSRSPDPRSIIPAERDVLTGLPSHFDHEDKSQQQSSQQQSSRQQSSQHQSSPPSSEQRASRPRRLHQRNASAKAAPHGSAGSAITAGVGAGGISAGMAVGAVVLVVAAVAATIFGLSRTSSPQVEAGPAAMNTAAATASAAFAPPTTAASGVGRVSRSAAATSTADTLGGPRTSESLGTAGERPGSSATGPTPRSSGSAPPSASATKATLVPATAVGLDGSYLLRWRIDAGTGTGASNVGRSGTYTWHAVRTCRAGGCRTVVSGDLTPASPGDKDAWVDHEWTETVVCRDAITNKVTGGSWQEHGVNSFHATAWTGTVVTAGTVTQRLEQLAPCPGQTSPLYSNTATMTFRRTGD